MSPDLFSLYSQRVMDELEGLEGMKVGGRNINNICYANDTLLVADSEDKLRELVRALHRVCTAKGFKIKFGHGKTEVTGITKRAEELTVNNRIEGRHITQIEKYKNLGVMVKKSGKILDRGVEKNWNGEDYLQQHEKNTIEHEYRHEIMIEIGELFRLVSFDVRW